MFYFRVSLFSTESLITLLYAFSESITNDFMIWNHLGETTANIFLAINSPCTENRMVEIFESGCGSATKIIVRLCDVAESGKCLENMFKNCTAQSFPKVVGVFPKEIPFRFPGEETKDAIITRNSSRCISRTVSVNETYEGTGQAQGQAQPQQHQQLHNRMLCVKIPDDGECSITRIMSSMTEVKQVSSPLSSYYKCKGFDDLETEVDDGGKSPLDFMDGILSAGAFPKIIQKNT